MPLKMAKRFIMIHGGNMKKFKVVKGDLFRLTLTAEELELIMALVSRVRLSTDGDAYKDAAYNLNSLFDEEFGLSYDNDNVDVGATITQNPDGSIDTTLEVSESGW